MRLTVPLTSTVLMTSAALFLMAPPASATPTPAPAETAPADPCAPVDGEVPVMCQSGVAPPAAEPAAELPLTGREDAPLHAAAGAGLVLLGGGLLVAGRRRSTPA